MLEPAKVVEVVWCTDIFNLSPLCPGSTLAGSLVAVTDYFILMHHNSFTVVRVILTGPQLMGTVWATCGEGQLVTLASPQLGFPTCYVTLKYYVSPRSCHGTRIYER